MKKKEEEFKVIFKFLDGRIIKREDFDAERDLTPEQNAKIIAAFSNVCHKQRNSN